jgi:hypothetical protein
LSAGHGTCASLAEPRVELHGDSIVQTLAAIGEAHTAALARVQQRESIIRLLTDAEVARVSRAEETTRLVEGDEYVDLEDLGSGVHQVNARSRVELGHALPRSAVSDATWAKIVRAVAI